MPVDSMPITHGEQMEALLIAKVWRQYIGVLVYFVRVAWLKTTGSCKCELCYHIESFLMNWVHRQ